MGRFNAVSEDVFKNLQLEAGVLLNTFDPDDPDEPDDEDIICATTGGVNATCVPTYTDFGEDIDNVPNRTKELNHLDNWECKFGFTALDVTPETIKMSLGAADTTDKYTASSDTSVVSGKTYYTRSGTSPNYTYSVVQAPTGNPSTSNYYELTGGTVIPRATLKDSDYSDLWWVGDKADGGMAAINLKNALSTGGFSLQTTKSGKGQLTCELTGYVSIEDTTEIPMAFYVSEV